MEYVVQIILYPISIQEHENYYFYSLIFGWVLMHIKIRLNNFIIVGIIRFFVNYKL